MSLCSYCGGPFEQPNEGLRGRPNAYCSVGCRRVAELCLRQAVRAVERVDELIGSVERTVAGIDHCHNPERAQRDLDRLREYRSNKVTDYWHLARRFSGEIDPRPTADPALESSV